MSRIINTTLWVWVIFASLFFTDRFLSAMEGPSLAQPLDVRLAIVTKIAGARDVDDFFVWVPAICVDSEQNILVLEGKSCQIFRFSPQGVLISHFGSKGEGPGEFRRPLDLMVDQDGDIFVLGSFRGQSLLSLRGLRSAMSSRSIWGRLPIMLKKRGKYL